MRVSPIGFAYSTLEEVLEMAKRSAEVTHNHPEGIRGSTGNRRSYLPSMSKHIQTPR